MTRKEKISNKTFGEKSEKDPLHKRSKNLKMIIFMIPIETLKKKIFSRHKRKN